MEMNHTPGPWTLDEDGTILSDFGTVATVHGWDNQDSETRPNGRLLAASPLLLEAAEAVRDAWESGDTRFGLPSPAANKKIQ